MSSSPELQVSLRQMIFAIETAVSLVGMNDTNHGKRVAYIASQLAHQLGYDDPTIKFVFELGLLHDCGVSTEQIHNDLVNHFDWQDAYIHCEIAYQLLKDFQPLAIFSRAIRYHHTPWKKLHDLEISRQDADMANLIFLADRIDIMSACHYETDILLVREEIVNSIKSYSGSYFNPLFVEAFLEREKSEAFWISLKERHILPFSWEMKKLGSNVSLTLLQLKQLSLIMAYIVDQKSPFTAQHSVRVADLARYIAQTFGLSAEQCAKIEIAGLLHDLGKLNTPDKILEKQGPLNSLERSIMNQHSYETYEILRSIDGLGEIAQWAAFHHEGLNGVGYPFHPSQKDLSIESRIIAVADVFQALVQDRPYRKGMTLGHVQEILDEFVDSEKLDSKLVDLVKQQGKKCFAIAKGIDQTIKGIELPAFTAEKLTVANQ
ncbi:MAG: HD domain-containing protein [Methyloprofundus sp.]|nr:HD domain-containing protein [Methyloprofundus sp.]